MAHLAQRLAEGIQKALDAEPEPLAPNDRPLGDAEQKKEQARHVQERYKFTKFTNYWPQVH